MYKGFTEIDGIIVNSDVLNTEFTCDLSKCKGACCTMESELGAPLESKEVTKMEEILPIVLDYLPEEHKNAIIENGFYEEDEDLIMTKSINNRACVFVYYDGDIAKCAIEKAYFDGKVEFRKPISCHLFPIRISDFGGPVVRYEQYSDCKPALEKGKETKLTIFEFCKDALTRMFGVTWYQKVKKQTESN